MDGIWRVILDLKQTLSSENKNTIVFQFEGVRNTLCQILQFWHCVLVFESKVQILYNLYKVELASQGIFCNSNMPNMTYNLCTGKDNNWFILRFFHYAGSYVQHLQRLIAGYATEIIYYGYKKHQLYVSEVHHQMFLSIYLLPYNIIRWEK